MKIAICTPTGGSVKASYVSSLLSMMTHYFNYPVIGWEDTSRATTYNLVIGSNISAQREEMIDEAIADVGVTHVLFIDDDMGWHPQCLTIALERKKGVVLANYRRKTPPWAFTARKIDGEGRAHEVITGEESRGLEEVTFGGFGFCLIDIKILKQMDKPRFLNRWIDYQQLYSTEDYPFFKAIHDKGLAKVYVDHDLSKLISHVGDFQYKYDTAPVMVAPTSEVHEFHEQALARDNLESVADR